ncbi:MAG TPA: oligosaccharide flippase family protein [Pirellulaceae bacterium]|nr:oligosaccharide flippase family protein [Pirellulaceae bacterium]HMO94000.1 oligosaccharide flippase family protein [Pirellulaceae bacterium]HMP70872.1 oligosaccharide flippase family protein [Pirellulaceae bacterium]
MNPDVDAELNPTNLPKRNQTSFRGDAVRLIAGTVIAQSIVVVTMPFLTRLYEPEMFGDSAFFLSIILIIGVLSCLRYELAIVLPDKDSAAANLLVACFGISLLLSLLLIPITIVSGPLVANLFKKPALTTVFWLVPLAFFIHGIFLALSYWHTRERNFAQLATAKITSSAMNSGSAFGLGKLGFASSGVLIASQIVGQALASLLMFFSVCVKNWKYFMQQVRWRTMLSELTRYRKFPLIESWSTLMNVLSANLPIVLLSFYFPPAVTGFFALSQKILNIPMAFLGRAISQVFFQRASVAVLNGNLPHVVLRTLKPLVLVSVFPFLMLMIIGPELFGVVFGDKWVEAGVFVQILAPWILLNFFYSPISGLISVLHIQESGFALNMLLLITRIASLVYGGMQENVLLGLILFSLSGSIIYPAFFIYLMFKSGTSLMEIWRHIRLGQFVGLALLAPIAFCKWVLLLSAPVLVGVAILSSGLFYAWAIMQDVHVRKLLNLGKGSKSTD